MLTLIILAISGLSLVLLIAVVLYSNMQSSVNRWLTAVMASGFLWVLSNFLANLFQYNIDLNLIFSRSALIGSALLPLTFLMFCAAYTNTKLDSKSKLLLSIPSLILIAISPSSLNVVRVSDDGRSIETGIAYPFLLFMLLLYFGVGIVLLMRHYKNSIEQTRQQINYILTGVVLTLLPGIVLSAILPLFGNSSTVSFGPAVVIIFAAFTTIAIIKHGLFDIKFYVFRGLVYTFSTLLLVVTYVAPIIWLLFTIFEIEYSKTQLLASTVTVSLLATNYHRIKTLFDTLSRNIFFRDEYEPAVVLANFNKTLASLLTIKDMISLSTKVIAENLKPEFSAFLIRGITGTAPRLVGNHSRERLDLDLNLLLDKLDSLSQGVTLTAVLADSKSIKASLQHSGIAVVVRLDSSKVNKKNALGYILIGARKNGSLYNPKDIQVLDAMSNSLVVAIQNAFHFEEIQQFNQTLQTRVDEATRKYRITNEKLKKLDETKDEFISMASHQLRTPLTSVKGYLSMVLEGDAGKLNKQQTDLLKQSFLSSERMVNLIADLLNLSRLNTGKFVIDTKPTDLRQVVSEELAQLSEAAKAKGLSFTYNEPTTFPILELDENKIHQVVMNFADNAIYYTPRGGKISVSLIETPTAVEYRVEDNGIGVPRQMQPHLFTKFYRAENAKRMRPDGTGLGLFMAKKVVIAQGGVVLFESEEGKGSMFGFRFPKSSSPKQPEPKQVK